METDPPAKFSKIHTDNASLLMASSSCNSVIHLHTVIKNVYKSRHLLIAQNDIQPWLTAIVFGTVSIFGGLLTLLLPETNRRPLPQTVEDIESWYRNSPNSFGDKAAQSLSSGKAEDTSTCRSVPSELHSLKSEVEW